MSDRLSRVASWLTPTVHGGAPLIAADDDKILSLFHEWMAAERLAETLPEDNDEFAKEVDRSVEIEHANRRHAFVWPGGVIVDRSCLISIDQY
jgi:hypothetical protein